MHPWRCWRVFFGLRSGGQGYEAPCFKQFSEIGYGLKLGDGCWKRRILEGTCNCLEALDDFIFRGWRRDGAKRMSEFNCIRDNLAFGITLDQPEAPVRVHRWSNVESSFGAEIP